MSGGQTRRDKDPQRGHQSPAVFDGAEESCKTHRGPAKCIVKSPKGIASIASMTQSEEVDREHSDPFVERKPSKAKAMILLGLSNERRVEYMRINLVWSRRAGEIESGGSGHHKGSLGTTSTSRSMCRIQRGLNEYKGFSQYHRP